jgi:hypothetical protein
LDLPWFRRKVWVMLLVNCHIYFCLFLYTNPCVIVLVTKYRGWRQRVVCRGGIGRMMKPLLGTLRSVSGDGRCDTFMNYLSCFEEGCPSEFVLSMLSAEMCVNIFSVKCPYEVLLFVMSTYQLMCYCITNASMYFWIYNTTLIIGKRVWLYSPHSEKTLLKFLVCRYVRI